MNKKLAALSDSFCFHPWTQLSMNPSGELMNCCQQRAESGYFFDKPGDVEKYWNSDQQKQLRQDLLAGKRPPICETCWKSEAAGMRSKRQYEIHYTPAAGLGEDQVLQMVEESAKNNGHNSSTPAYLDLKPGNKCNLKCRMCLPENSHLLHAELVNHAEAFESIRFYYSYGLEAGSRPSWSREVSVEQLIPMSRNLNRLNISGGEPLLNPMVHKYLAQLVKENIAPQIHITFNTNGLLMNRELYSLFKAFKKAEVYVSVDGVGAIYDYIRFPAKWSQIDENMDEILKFAAPNVNIIVSPTIQAINVLSIGEIHDWAAKKGAHFDCGGHVTFPDFHSPLILPAEARKKAVERLEILKTRGAFTRYHFPIDEIVAYLQSDNGDYAAVRKDFVTQTQALDKIRGQDLQASCPELYMFIRDWFSHSPERRSAGAETGENGAESGNAPAEFLDISL